MWPTRGREKTREQVRARRRTFLVTSLVGGILLSTVAGASGATASEAASHLWQGLTRIDVDAIYESLETDHPAAALQVGDKAFLGALEAGYARALTRTNSVGNLAGYTAVIAEFVHSLGDGHINALMNAIPRTVEWPGFTVVRHGTDWAVAAIDPDTSSFDLVGAKILTCDGRALADLAQERLRFRTNVAVDAMLVVNAPWLLVDDGNPFLPRLDNCTIEKDGTIKSLQLHWSKIPLDSLQQRYWPHTHGEAGFGIDSVDAGYWIEIGLLNPRAQTVVDAVSTKLELVRHSRFVVVDLRGNGGGNDAYGRAIADALYGRAFVAQRLGTADDASRCRPVFRASADNLRKLTGGAQVLERSGDTEGAREYTIAATEVRAAMAA